MELVQVLIGFFLHGDNNIFSSPTYPPPPQKGKTAKHFHSQQCSCFNWTEILTSKKKKKKNSGHC
jgi:hypothetical protein